MGNDNQTTTNTSRQNRSRNRWILSIGLLVAVLGLLAAGHILHERLKQESKKPVALPKPITRPLKPAETTAVLAGKETPSKKKSKWHPPHDVKTWLTAYKGHTYRVIQLPRCEHLETVIRYNPAGETSRQAKKRAGGVAASTGSFHNPKSMVLADFLQRKGSIMAPARTGRRFVAVDSRGAVSISGDYNTIKGNPRYSAIALGQRLVPLRRDGFPVAFMNRITDRMAVGLNKSYIYIVQSNTSIWRLSEFLSSQLPVTSAINCDGGHVVRGRGPVHLVFRWKKPQKAAAKKTSAPAASPAAGRPSAKLPAAS